MKTTDIGFEKFEEDFYADTDTMFVKTNRAKDKPIKIVFEDDVKVTANGNEIEIKRKLSDIEAKKLLNDVFGTTDIGILDCSDMTDEEIDKIVEKFNSIPEEYDFDTEFPTWIIAFCPDTDSWFVTNQRFFYYEYDKEFPTEEEGIKFFKDNPKIFYDEEIRMEVYRPYFRKNGVLLDNTNEFVKL